MLFNKKMSLWLWLWNHDEIHQAKGCKSLSLWLCECTCEHVVQGHSMYVYGCTWRWGNKVWLVSEWVSVWINSMCDGLTHFVKVADLVQKAICAIFPDLHGDVSVTASNSLSVRWLCFFLMYCICGHVCLWVCILFIWGVCERQCRSENCCVNVHIW